MMVLISLSLYYVFFIVLTLYVGLYIFFRKKIQTLSEHVSSDGIPILAPVNGKIIHVERNVSHGIFGEKLTEIQILIPWWSEFGIFLPLHAEVKNIILHKGRSFFRYQKAFEKVGANIGRGISLSLEHGVQIIGLTFYKCKLGMTPELIVQAGDIGRPGVNIGYFPLGGTLVMYLPAQFEIMCVVDQKIDAQVSVLANKQLS